MKLGRQQLLASIGLLALGVVLGLLGLLLAVLPQHSKAGKLDAEIAAAQVQLASLPVGGSRVPAIRAADLFQLARAMPDGDDMSGILLDLARSARISSVSITSIAPALGVAQADGSTVVPLHLVVDGRWTGITAFLRTLRRQVRVHGERLTVSGRLFVVDDVQISAGSGTSEVTATLTADAFVYGVAPPPVTTTGTDGTTTTTSSSGSEAAAAPGSAG